MNWGETPRSALRFARQATGASPEALLKALKTLLTKIECQRFYADAPTKVLDFSTTRRILHAYLTNRCNLRCPQCYLVNLLLSLDDDKLMVAVNEAWAEERARSGQFCPEPAAMDDAIHGILSQLREKGWAGDPPRRPRQPRYSCSYGGSVIVAANGDVHPCPILHRPVGNVCTTALADLMARLQQIYFETSVDHMAECADCESAPPHLH